MAITVVADATTTSDTRTLSWTIPTLASGDIVVVAAETWDNGITLANPSGTGLAFGAPKAVTNVASTCNAYVWAMAATAGGSSVVVTTAPTGGTSIHNGWLYVCPTADGYSLAGSPHVLNSAPLAATLQGTLAGASGNLGIVVVADWNGTDGASRAWDLSATEDGYQFSSGNNTSYAGHCTLTGASQSVGLSAPTTGVTGSIAAIEILKSAGGTNATVTFPQSVSIHP